jgi:hypothetical protein
MLSDDEVQHHLKAIARYQKGIYSASGPSIDLGRLSGNKTLVSDLGRHP